ncbi:hypothetical protein FB451DRAFT_262913 [Mycena latifolia]|nr:hypothetical protein FB451DRAFT_262913 [Mycena latifolia]
MPSRRGAKPFVCLIYTTTNSPFHHFFLLLTSLRPPSSLSPPPPLSHCDNMFATLLTLALFAAPALNGVAALSIETPSLTQCGSAHISWDATKGPYNLIVVDSADPCGDVLADLGDHTTTSITWKVDFAANKTLMFSLEDANGDEAWSGEMKVAASSDASCLNNAAAAASSSAVVAGSSSKSTIAATATVGAAGAAVTGGSSSTGDDGTTADPLGAASGSNGAAALHMNPVMALCALFAAFALAL